MPSFFLDNFYVDVWSASQRRLYSTALTAEAEEYYNWLWGQWPNAPRSQSAAARIAQDTASYVLMYVQENIAQDTASYVLMYVQENRCTEKNLTQFWLSLLSCSEDR